jgi:hypothetical protein
MSPDGRIGSVAEPSLNSSWRSTRQLGHVAVADTATTRGSCAVAEADPNPARPSDTAAAANPPRSKRSLVSRCFICPETRCRNRTVISCAVVTRTESVWSFASHMEEVPACAARISSPIRAKTQAPACVSVCQWRLSERYGSRREPVRPLYPGIGAAAFRTAVMEFAPATVATRRRDYDEVDGAESQPAR